MKQPAADFVIVLDNLKKEGKIKISPISREANSFDCPKCGSLLSPDNPNSYSEFGYEEDKGALIQCKRCKTRIKLLWQTDPSRSICKQFKKPKLISLFFFQFWIRPAVIIYSHVLHSNFHRNRRRSCDFLKNSAWCTIRF